MGDKHQHTANTHENTGSTGGVRRRHLLGGIAAVGAASTLAAPAISQNRLRWRMQTTWPPNFPGLGTGANYLAEYIGRASDGRLTVEVSGGGEIVPSFETIDAVSQGTIEMGHGAPYYWKNKEPAAQYIAAVPFGLSPVEQTAWVTFGGGQELGDEIYRRMGCKFFASGNTGVQMGGWFNREINSLDDYKGLKMRIPGLGGEVVKAAGGNVINLPGGEIPPALASGAIDATEWVGPYNDLAFGLYKSARYYYYPGWHEPGTVLDNFINLAAWESLPQDLQAIVAAANAAANQYVYSEFLANNSAALDALTGTHGVILRAFPRTVLNGLGELTGRVLSDLIGADAQSRKVMASIIAFRRSSIAWSRVSQESFLSARRLPFKWIDNPAA